MIRNHESKPTCASFANWNQLGRRVFGVALFWAPAVGRILILVDGHPKQRHLSESIPSPEATPAFRNPRVSAAAPLRPVCHLCPPGSCCPTMLAAFVTPGAARRGLTHRPQSSSVLGLPYRILVMNPKQELLWGL